MTDTAFDRQARNETSAETSSRTAQSKVQAELDRRRAVYEARELCLRVIENRNMTYADAVNALNSALEAVKIQRNAIERKLKEDMDNRPYHRADPD